jgi:putative membrane protein
MKYWIRIGVSMLFLAGAASAHADELDRSDAHFIEQAAQAGAFEIEASQWAARNAEHDEVKRYASTMIADHTGVADQLKALAAAKGVSLPADLSVIQTRAIKALQAETGARFDQDYADDVAIAAHKDAITLFVEAAERARDPEVKAFAQQTLPALKAHLDAGMALRKSLAASGKASPAESPSAPGEGATGAAPGTVSPASRQAPPTLLPGDKGAPKP